MTRGRQVCHSELDHNSEVEESVGKDKDKEERKERRRRRKKREEVLCRQKTACEISACLVGSEM